MTYARTLAVKYTTAGATEHIRFLEPLRSIRLKRQLMTRLEWCSYFQMQAQVCSSMNAHPGLPH